jgi:hypothetical protein
MGIQLKESKLMLALTGAELGNIRQRYDINSVRSSFVYNTVVKEITEYLFFCV